MSKRFGRLDRGDSTLEGILILAILIFIFIGFILPGRTKGPVGTADRQRAESARSGDVPSPEITSSYEGRVSLGRGNAPYAIQSYEEYITITNRGREPLDITGWQLRNAKDERIYTNAGGGERYAADVVNIPRSAKFISPIGQNSLQNVVLESGEKAIVTTGSIGATSPYKIPSFKENMCTGYIENLDQYSFTPALRRSCPDPEREVGVSGLDRECREFVGRIRSCHTPEIGGRDRDGETCHNCVDGVPLSSACVAFIRTHYNYAGCLANHVGNPDFYDKTWRIFLGRGWEMWAEDYETIKLYDQFGRLVDYISY